MKTGHANASNIKGFSLLEIIVVIVIISILFGLAINHIFKWRITAEQTSIQKLRSEMHEALRLQVTSFYARGRLQDIVSLVATNPLDYAIEKPDAYIGEQQSVKPENLTPGSWVYDTSKKILIYRVLYPEHFSTNLPGVKRIEFKVSLIYTDINNNKQFNRGVDTIEGLRLNSGEAYSWVLNPEDNIE